MKITTLIENECLDKSSGLAAEWGLSLHLECEEKSILFDVGETEAFAANAERLGIDIAGVDALVISHQHSDHGGGLKKFFELNNKASVYLAASPHDGCYLKVLGFIKKYIGLDQEVLSKHKNRLKFITAPTQLFENIHVFHVISSGHQMPKANKLLYVKKNNKLIHDDFSHEIIMVAEESDGLVVFTGCSHNGVLNMIDSVKERFGDKPIKAAIGGMHLVALPPFNRLLESRNEVEVLAKALLDYPITKTYSGHCTSPKAFLLLQNVMGERLGTLTTGSIIEV